MLYAFETATREASLCVLDPATGETRAFVTLPGKDTAGTLAVAAAKLLEAHGDPSGYAFDIGPGSFTGLRVGLAFMKGLARARPAPVAEVGSLECLASQFEGEGRVVVALPASGGAVFAAAYALTNGRPTPLPELPVGLYRPEAAAPVLGSLGALRGGGQGIQTLVEAGAVLQLEPAVRIPSASDVARLGRLRLDAGEGVASSSVEPAYHQLSAAEEKFGPARYD